MNLPGRFELATSRVIGAASRKNSDAVFQISTSERPEYRNAMVEFEGPKFGLSTQEYLETVSENSDFALPALKIELKLSFWVVS